jgi:hypothetical protein
MMGALTCDRPVNVVTVSVVVSSLVNGLFAPFLSLPTSRSRNSRRRLSGATAICPFSSDFSPARSCRHTRSLFRIMTEPSYFPLSDLKSPQSAGSSSLKSPFTYDPDLPHADEAAGLEEPPQESRSSMYLAPLRPQLFRRSPGRPSLWRVVRSPLKMALLPLAALGYLAFCYSVHGKVVPVNTHGLYSVTPQHLCMYICI